MTRGFSKSLPNARFTQIGRRSAVGWVRLFQLLPVVFGVLLLGTTLTASAAPRQRLSGHLPPAVTGLTPLDRLDGSARLELAIGLPLRNQAEFDLLLEQLYDPASTNYQHYLTREEFTERFGPTPEDYQAVMDFSRAHGLTVTRSFSNRTLVVVNGAVADIEKALQLKLQVYQHPTENRRFFAPDTEPSLDLSVPILSIEGLDNYVIPHPMNLVVKPVDPAAHFQAAGSLATTGSGPGGNFIGSDFRAAYAPGVSLTGTGQSVGLFELDGYFPVDITNYKNQAGLPNVPVTNVLVGGFSGTAGSNNVEVALDIEMAISMAPGLSQVVVYEGTSPNAILMQMLQDNLANQYSASWTYSVNSTTTNLFREYAAAGKSFFNASGDSGEYKTTPAPPTDDPFITIVGGTTLSTANPGGPWSTEIVWNWYTTGEGPNGSSGGTSQQYALPTWQKGLPTTTNQASTTRRNIPDVALTADNVWVAIDDGSSGMAGGTSCAAPLWAGFTALMNQQAAANGRTNVGFLNPAIYTIAKGVNYTNAFHDITVGNNTNTSSATKFFATTGYDLCTGLGTPNGANLIYALVPVPLIVAQPVNEVVAPGNNATFTVSAAVGATLFYQWQFNGSNLPDATNSSLTITNAQVTNAGDYDVVISNNLYSVTSSNVTLTVSAPPIFSLSPQSQSVPQGTDVTFTGAATGTPTPTYQWQFNGADLIGATDTNLTVVDAQLGNQGNYTLVASNSGGAVTSLVAVLTVQVPPSISSQPASRTANPGATTLFAVGISGSTPLSYQWFFDETNAIVGATNSFVIIANVQGSQAGDYMVVVTNDYGAVTSAVATLTVNVPPGITSQPQSESLTVGDTANFSVTANGPGSLTYQWLLNNTNLSDNARISGSQTANLTIMGVVTGDAGSYQAVVANTFGSTNSSVAMLTVARAIPTLTWTASSAITYGTALSSTQLNATASQPGTFAYSPSFGSVPGAGTNLLSVIFTPSDAADFNSVTGSVSLAVLPVPLTVTAADATRIYGQTNPVFTATISGAVNGDVFAASATSAAGVTNLPGTYPIVPSVSDTNNRLGNYVLTLINGTLTITAAAAPTIASISPDTGFTNGGTTVTISGTGFQNGATVNFGALAAVSVTVTNDTNIIAITPAADLGTVDVVLTNADGQTVVFTNGFSYVASQVIDVTPAQITGEPTNQAAAIGGSATFTLTAIGAAPLVYQWAFNQTNLPSATNFNLAFTNVQPSNAGMYQAIVSNAFGAATSSVVTLSVLGTPVSFLTGAGAFQYSNGQFVLQLAGLTGQGPVIIESSTNLVDWTPIFTNTPAFGQIQFVDPNASNSPSGYYRAFTPVAQ